MNDLSDYRRLIAAKRVAAVPTGIRRTPELNPAMFDYQVACTQFALRAGRSALFLDTGMGKSLCALDWGRCVVEETNKPVLMLAPLGVVHQHLAEAAKFGIEAKISRTGAAPSTPQLVITNYDRLERFEPEDYGGVILDESSVLKSFSSVTTKKLTQAFSRTPFRLCCSATPAPNDHAELGTHSEFLSVLPLSQMLVRWFLHDSADTGTWRMKRHAVRDFWDWVASWARCLSRPSDLGFSDDGFEMPPLNVHKHIVKADRGQDTGEERDGQFRLFRLPDTSATSIHKEKRLTMQSRCETASKLILDDLESLRWTAGNDGNSIRTASTRSGERTTEIQSPDTQRVSQEAEKKPPHIQQSDLSSRFDTRTELNSKIISPSYGGRTDAAQSAVGLNREAMGDSTSIIATTQERSEVFSATHATSASAISETMKSLSSVRSITSVEPMRSSWVLWCEMNEEQKILEEMLRGKCISITGSHSPDIKEELHDAWLRGEKPILLTKPTIFGYGVNWQHCHKMAFVGLSFSYENYYQAIRRCWRFRQKRAVEVHIVCADTEASIWDVVSRKSGDHEAMKAQMSAAMARAHQSVDVMSSYNPQLEARLPAFLR